MSLAVFRRVSSYINLVQFGYLNMTDCSVMLCTKQRMHARRARLVTPQTHSCDRAHAQIGVGLFQLLIYAQARK